MNIFVVRHGITDWNLQRRAQGREDIPLNEGGKLQAQDCGTKLQGLKIDYMVSSPLCRATKTAEIIGGFLGIDQVRTMEAFTEMDFGRISGTTQDEFQRKRAESEKYGVESREAVQGRIKAGLMQLQEEYGECNVMLVSHGALIRNLLRLCLPEQEIPDFLENCGVCLLSYRAGALEPLLINRRADEFMVEYHKIN